MLHEKQKKYKDSHKEHEEREEHKEESEGVCLLSYREIIKFRLLTTTLFFPPS